LPERSRPTSPAPADLGDTWSRIHAELRRAVSERAYAFWLAGLRPVELHQDRLVLSAPAPTCRWVGARFGRVLHDAAAVVMGPQVRVDVIPATLSSTGNGTAAVAAPRPPTVPFRELALNPKYTFDQFVIGNQNRLAHAAALAVAELPGQAYNPLFIYGPPGVGKTHLLHAITAYLHAYNPSVAVRACTIEDFTSDFVSAVKTDSMGRFKSHYRNTDVLIIDDVQFLQSKARTEEEFLHTFNALYDTGSQLVLVSDRLPRDMANLEDRLCERFLAGLVTDIQPPDFDTRVAILRKRIQHDDIVLADEDAVELIAARVTHDVRALESALIRIIAHQSLTQTPITRARTLAVLDRLYPAPAARTYSIEAIQHAVCQASDVRLEDVLSRSRTARIARARQLAMFLSRELTDSTLPDIGRQFGGRDHTTVMHGCQQVQRKLTHDAGLRAAITRVRAILDDTH
jgi:chromosomal replication initiator protein